MRRCKGCNRPLPDDSAPQRRYCDHPECRQERANGRKAHERARAYNALTRVEAPIEVGVPKRKTSSTHDAGGNHEDDLNFDPGKVTSRWDAISNAWRAARGYRWEPPEHPGAEVFILPEVDRLMGEAGRNARRRGVGQLTAPWSTEDYGCAGELWLRGKHEAAERKARKDTRYAHHRAERSGNLDGHVWFSVKTPHGVAAMYAETKPPARVLGGHESFNYEDLTGEQESIEALMQSNEGAF